MKQMPLLTLAAAALLLSSCTLFHQKAQEDEPAADTAADSSAKPAKTAAAPTAEQQAAARKALAEEAAIRAEEEALLNTPAAPADSAEVTPTLSTGGLRLHRFAPPEEAVSSNEGTDMPVPNAAELHGLRSPVLRGGALPMDINGKITPTDSQE